MNIMLHHMKLYTLFRYVLGVHALSQKISDMANLHITNAMMQKHFTWHKEKRIAQKSMYVAKRDCSIETYTTCTVRVYAATLI